MNFTIYPVFPIEGMRKVKYTEEMLKSSSSLKRGFTMSFLSIYTSSPKEYAECQVYHQTINESAWFHGEESPGEQGMNLNGPSLSSTYYKGTSLSSQTFPKSASL